MSGARREELAERLRGFHGVELEQVLEVIEYLRDGEDSVLVGGSLAYGLGNEKSDLDIVVAGPPGSQSSSRMPLEHFIDTLRVDVWKLRRNELEALFELAQSRLADPAPFAGAFGDVFEQADLKLLHRVAYGVVIDGPQMTPEAGREYRAVAGQLLVREYAERMRHALFVAQLARAAGRPLAAAINARFGVEDALQAAIAARGIPFSDNKWLQTRLEGEAADLRETYRPFTVLPEGTAASAAFVEAAVAAAEELVGTGLGAAALAADAAWENGGLRLRPAGDLLALLDPEQDVIYELDPEEAEAWRALGEGAAWPCARCSEAQAELCFALYAEGMLKLSWSRGLPVGELGLRVGELDEVR